MGGLTTLTNQLPDGLATLPMVTTLSSYDIHCAHMQSTTHKTNIWCDVNAPCTVWLFVACHDRVSCHICGNITEFQSTTQDGNYVAKLYSLHEIIPYSLELCVFSLASAYFIIHSTIQSSTLLFNHLALSSITIASALYSYKHEA